jgi:cytochrome b561
MPSDRTAFALWLDVLLLLLFLLVQSPRITGVMAHEVIGIAIAVPLLIHLLLSWHWIVSKARRLFANGGVRTRINYAINVALFSAMVVVIASGVLVSRAALPAIGIATIYDRDWFELHDTASNVLFACVGLHLAMNWGWVLAAWRRRAFSPEEQEAADE